MKLFLLAILLITTCLTSFSQTTMQLLSNLNYQELHDAQLNDIWGYTDEEGNEYAIVGTTKGTSIVDITDPTNPVEVFWEPGTESIWRDMVTWGDFAYVSTEAQSGLLIIDLRPLPHSHDLPVNYYMGDGGVSIMSAHTVYADNGYCFLFGTKVGNGGVQILDIHTDPMNPIRVSEFDNWYCHDGVVQNNLMYLGHIYDGFFSVVDISDIHNPVLLGTHTTPSNFTHNVWPTPDGNFVFTTDEVSGGFIGAYDISDLNNIFEIDRIQSSPGRNVVPHNVHFLNDFLITSYYSDGVTIHDATYPYNLIEVAKYDTYPYQTTGFDGCWGAYPYLPSGNVLATDREYGLYVLGVSYQKAAYLEGTITDISTGLPIDDVKITIYNNEHENRSNETGFYATGRANGGVASVTYEKIGYYTEMDNIVLTNGVITTHDIQMIPIPPYQLHVKVIDEQTNNPISNVNLKFETDLVSHDGITNGIGEEDMTLYYEEIYTVTAGKWGYITKCASYEINSFTNELTIKLQKGYYDDFTFDYGWYTTGSAVSGLWTRDIPFGTQEVANPDRDAPWDCSNYAYVTGNTPNYDFTVDEVAGGDVQLFSPMMDLTSYDDPYVNYFKWFYTRYGVEPFADSLSIFLLNGSQTKQIDVMKERQNMNEWVHTSIRIIDYLPVTANMQILVMTSDFDPDWNVVEAGFDHFYISNASTLNVENITKQKTFNIAPNPTSSTITIHSESIGAIYEIVDLNGRVLEQKTIHSNNFEIDMSQYANGIYLLKMNNQIERIIKQ